MKQKILYIIPLLFLIAAIIALVYWLPRVATAITLFLQLLMLIYIGNTNKTKDDNGKA